MASPDRYVVREVSGRYLREIAGFQLLLFPDDDLVDPVKGFWWLAFSSKGHPVAFAGLTQVPSWTSAGFLCRAGVLADHRGQGLQRRLIRARVNKAKRIGLTHVISTTYDNPRSANNLVAEGFHLYQPESPWGAEGTNYWIKNLTNGKA